ncbi:uncharacterized protein LOC142999142 [Genypterus blacodes]|uniref:uncharacterized protein LOC142999142 n=1 Tax=Genypterus blacodes TaxID=154954 RepID=UPI003F7704D8
MILLFELHHTLIYKKYGGMTLTFLYFALTGVHLLITVLQPPVIVTSLGHDVVMRCELIVDEKLTSAPLMYWENVVPDRKERDKVFPPLDRYKGRVDRLDMDRHSSNKSILFRSVQWDDSGTYLCKVTIATTKSKGSMRKLGEGTSLLVYDTMFFNTTSNNSNLLQCAVNVSWDPAFVLSILQGGLNLKIQKPAEQTLPYVTLSESVTPNCSEEYECQLHLNAELITTKIFFYNGAVITNDGGGEKNETAEADPDVAVLPQPWLLYLLLILVPVTVLLAVLTALLVHSRGCSGASH